MGRVVPLSDNKVKNLKHKEKDYKVADGDGLYLLVTSKGSKLWKLRYSINGKSSTKALGKYPLVSLAQARAKREEIRSNIANNGTIDNEKMKGSDIVTFRKLCDLYFEHRSDLSEHTAKDYKSALKNHYYPTLENIDCDNLSPSYIIDIVSFLDKQKKYEVMKKTGSLIDRIFQFGVTLRHVKTNPMASIDLKVITTPHKKKNFPHTTSEEVFKEILLSIEDYNGELYTKTALQIMPYVFLRPSNITGAKWKHIDFKNKVWKVPAEDRKKDKEHIVPLTDSMINIIKQVKRSGSEYVFPSVYSKTRKMSDNTLNMALKRLGWANVQTAHGFRHTASTILNEHIGDHGVSSDIIEVQLAHIDKNTIKGTYNKAIYLKDRIKLMKWWGDFIDKLKS